MNPRRLHSAMMASIGFAPEAGELPGCAAGWAGVGFADGSLGLDMRSRLREKRPMLERPRNERSPIDVSLKRHVSFTIRCSRPASRLSFIASSLFTLSLFLTPHVRQTQSRLRP